MQIIVTCGQGFTIGKDNERLVSIPADLKWIRRETEGGTVVLGRKTFEKMTGSPVLGTQKILVLSTDKNYHPRGATVCHSIEELLKEVETEPSERVYCIGGESLYQQLLPYCDTVHMTKVDYPYEANRYFPNLDDSEEWRVAEESEENTYFDLEYTYVRYERA